MSAGASRLTLASFNVHCGVDGWGRPFDLVNVCAGLDVDILVLQESWTPVGAASNASVVAEHLGYQRVEAAMAEGRLYAPDPSADARWGPPRRQGHAHDTLRLDAYRRGREAAEHQQRPFTRGTLSLAVLARVPFREHAVIPLGQLRNDPARRLLVVGTVDLGGHRLTVLGTHMSHLLHRSPLHYLQLRSLVPPSSQPAVLAGDMNLWGPPASAFLPGWRRAVRGRTWPSWCPHSQLDHVMTTPSVSVEDARVVTASGSDHRPVRVTLSVG